MQYSKTANRQPRPLRLRHRNGRSLAACLATDHVTGFATGNVAYNSYNPKPESPGNDDISVITSQVELMLFFSPVILSH